MNKFNTLEEVLKEIMDTLPLPERINLKKTRWDNLILLHHTFGMQIRNHFLLWDGNTNLAKDMGLKEGAHADEVSQKIIEELWKKLQEE